MTYRIRNIGIALALALVAVLLVSFYVSNYKRTVQSDEENVTVYVAKSDIAAGTTGAEAARLMETEDIARRNVAPGAVSDPAQLAEKVATDPIYAGEQVTATRFSSLEERGIRSQLTGNVRAIEVPGEAAQLLSGTLRAGDHVDVVATWNVPEQATNHFSRTILRDILVLRAPQGNTSSKLTNPNESLSVMLALTDSQAEKLWWIAKNGAWSLTLRAPTDATDSPQGVEKDVTVLLDGLNRAQLRKIISDAQRFAAEGGK
jgi:Flp pilus assembly protein CpaB